MGGKKKDEKLLHCCCCLLLLLFTLLEDTQKRDSEQVLDTNCNREEPEKKSSSRARSRNKQDSCRRDRRQNKTKNPRKRNKDQGERPGESLHDGETPAHETTYVADVNSEDRGSSKLQNICTRVNFTGFRIERIEHRGRKDSYELRNNKAKDGRKDTRHGLPLGKTLDNIHHSKEGKTTDCILKRYKQGEYGDGAAAQRQA